MAVLLRRAGACGLAAALLTLPLPAQDAPETPAAKEARAKSLAAAHRWVNEPAQPLPAGVTHHRYRSAAMDGGEVGYCVYLPPGYANEPTVRYPVVYWLHGGGGNELTGVPAVAPVADRAIRSGEVPPMIIVFNNGGPAWHYDDPAKGQWGETALIRELIPLIDRTYRTIPERRGRAVEGMSMGGRATARNIFRHADLFCSAAALATGIGNEQKAVDAGLHADNNVFSLARAHAARKEPAVRLLLVIGTEDLNYPSNLEYFTFLEKLGVPFERLVLDGVAHNNRQYYEKMGSATLRFHSRSFRLAQW